MASSRKTQFPAAKFTLTIGRKDYDLTVGVSKHLTVVMLMEQDILHLRKYFREELEVASPVQPPPSPSPPPPIATESSTVVTRMQQQAQDQCEREEEFEQERDKPVTHPLDSVYDGGDVEGTEGRSMNQDEESAEEAESEQDSGTGIGQETALIDATVFSSISPDQLKSEHLKDPTLRKVRSKVGTRNSTYFLEDGVLMRTPFHINGKNLVVVPQFVRTKVMQLAHNSLVVGHFGRERMLELLTRRLDWPGLAKVVKNMCQSCPICQGACPTIVTKAPLYPLPNLKTPFQRVAMDIFWPLKRTPSKNTYILVVMDYSTKWPEAFGLKNKTAETVIDCS